METAPSPGIGYGYISGGLTQEETDDRKGLIELKAQELKVPLDHIFVEPAAGHLEDFSALLGALRFHMLTLNDVVVFLNRPQDIRRSRWAHDWALAQLKGLAVKVEWT
jgi:hypothetical protein